MTGELVHGEIDGLVWYEAPMKAMGYRGKDLPDDGTMIVLAPSLPGEWERTRLRTDPDKMNHERPGPFIPFDLAEAFPGRHVAYRIGGFNDGAITDWILSRSAVPDGLELAFQISGFSGTEGSRIMAVARTMRNGRVVLVKRPLDPSMPVLDALAKETPWLLRNCPRPPSDASPYSCSKHVAHILDGIAPIGADRIRAWLTAHEDKPDHTGPLPISGHFLPGTGIDRLTLSITGTGVVRADIQLVGGHLLKDDDTGVEVTIEQPLPDTLVNGLKGTSLDRIVDVEWAADLVIRLARAVRPGERKTTMRVAAPGVEFRLPEAAGPADEPDSLRAMLALGEHRENSWPAVTEVSAAALAPLRALTAEQFVAVVRIMQMEGKADLGLFGHDGWRLRLRGSGIVVDDSPDVAWSDFLREVKGIEIDE